MLSDAVTRACSSKVDGEKRIVLLPFVHVALRTCPHGMALFVRSTLPAAQSVLAYYAHRAARYNTRSSHRRMDVFRCRPVSHAPRD
jgi:hypothetical protein